MLGVISPVNDCRSGQFKASLARVCGMFELFGTRPVEAGLMRVPARGERGGMRALEKP